MGVFLYYLDVTMYQLSVCADTTFLKLQFAINTYPVAKKLNCSTPVIHHDESIDGSKFVHNIDSNPISRCVTAYKGLRNPAESTEANTVTRCLEILKLNQGLILMGAPLQVFRAIANAITILFVVPGNYNYGKVQEM